MKKVAICALSNGLGPVFPHIVELARINYKKYFNLETKSYETLEMSPEAVRDNPKLRANELNKALWDDEVLFINALIGGSDSIRILDDIDLEAPNKVVMGFSDATSYLSYLAINNKKAYYGPSILAGIAELHNYGDEYLKMMNDILFTEKNITYPIFKFYANSYKNWNDKECKGELEDINKTKGPLVLNGTGVVKGRLWGGCMDSLEQMKGTKYYPKKEYLKGKIIFFETSENKPSPELVRRWLYNYCISETFSGVKGIIFGIFKDYTEAEKEEVYKLIKAIIVEEYGYDIPIVVNCPFGHTIPTWILPYNEELQIDLDRVEFTLNR